MTEPFVLVRVVGQYCSDVPCILRQLSPGKEPVVVVAQGRAFQTYNSLSLRFIASSDQLPANIQCIAADALYVYTACGADVQAFHMSRKLKYTYEGHSTDVVAMLPFGAHLVTVDKASRLIVWDIENEEVVLELTFDAASFCVTALCHPPTYVNKVLLGSEQGSLKLFNLKTNQLIYTFEGWNSAVRVLQASPAIDVVAAGLQNGDIVLHNLKFDEILFRFRQEFGPISALTFRTDGPSLLLSGTAQGYLATWDLDKRRLVNLHHAHTGSLAGLVCLSGEPVAVSNGADNALRAWMFDQPGGGPRLLAVQEGHSAPPSAVRFYGPEMVISAGRDGMIRMFSTEKVTKSYSIGSAWLVNKRKAKRKGLDLLEAKMPGITALAASNVKEIGWDNLVCCHEATSTATVWSTRKRKVGTVKLCHDRFAHQKELRNAVALCCCLSTCGNFALIGYSSGHVDKYNVQSGIHRGGYVTGDASLAHDVAVTGVCVAGFNECTMTTDATGLVKFWTFKKAVLKKFLEFGSAVHVLEAQQNGPLVACALDGGGVVLIDWRRTSLSRRFDGTHNTRVTSVTFTDSGHWLITAAVDGSLKIWDLATATLIGRMQLTTPCERLAMSPDSVFLATTHVGELGVSLWVNRAALTKDFRITATTETLNECMDELALTESERLTTLAGRPLTDWADVLHLELIRQRNKPKLPPRKPQQAPFFLGTVGSLSAAARMPDLQTETQNRLMKLAPLELKSPFRKMLEVCTDVVSFVDAFDKFGQLDRFGMDSEVRSWISDEPYVLSQFLKMIDVRLETKRDFELCETFLAVCLKVHRSKICETYSLREMLSSVESKLELCWGHLDQYFDSSLCLLNFWKSVKL